MSRFPHARFMLSAAAAAQFPPDHGVEIAFAGRSNAGKSTAINAIVGRHSLARTSKAPGQTRLLNFFELAAGARLVDLPGYGYARVGEAERRKWVALTEALRRRTALRGLFLIVDIRRGFAAADADLVAWAEPTVRRVHVLLSKADKLSRGAAAKVLRETTAVLQDQVSVQLFSALEHTGTDTAQRMLRQLLVLRGADNEKTPVASDEATGAD